MNDGVSAYNYTNPRLIKKLEAGYDTVRDVLAGHHPHPVVDLYTSWMDIIPDDRTSKQHSMAFLEHNFNIMPKMPPGDLALIIPFHTRLQQEDGVVDPLAHVPAHILFRIIILRHYLCREPADDEEIFYLALKFTETDLAMISKSDRFYKAKHGHIQRFLTVPEQALAAAQGSSDTRLLPLNRSPPSTTHVKVAEATLLEYDEKADVIVRAMDANSDVDYVWTGSGRTIGAKPRLECPEKSKSNQSRPPNPNHRLTVGPAKAAVGNMADIVSTSAVGGKASTRSSRGKKEHLGAVTGEANTKALPAPSRKRRKANQGPVPATVVSLDASHGAEPIEAHLTQSGLSRAPELERSVQVPLRRSTRRTSSKRARLESQE